MEDQQPAAGDLTVAAPDEQAADDTEAKDEDTEATDEDTEAEEPTSADDEVKPAPVSKPNWFSRNKVALGVGTSAALFVAAGAFGAAAVQPYLADRAAVATKLDIARTAADAITTLWTYTPEDMDKLPERSAR